MWLLEASGDFTHVEAPDFGTEVPGEGPAAMPQTPVAAVRFGAYADGRGFSTGNTLRALGYKGRLVAVGALSPDLARHAFQTGFDAIAVDDALVARHGEDAWRNAMGPKVKDLYMPDPASRGPEGAGLWARRHNGIS